MFIPIPDEVSHTGIRTFPSLAYRYRLQNVPEALRNSHGYNNPSFYEISLWGLFSNQEGSGSRIEFQFHSRPIIFV